MHRSATVTSTRFAICAISAISTISALSPSAVADVIPVAPGESIQAAIDAASIGDEIVVAPGVYAQTIDFRGKAVTVRSAAGAKATVIDASGLGDSAVTCRDGETLESVLDGFTITGGSGRDVSGKTYGGGMYIKLSNPTVRNCVFMGNTADAGGGVAAISVSYGVIDNCQFIANTAMAGGYYGGGGIFMQGCYSVVSRCRFAWNEATGAAKGGGIGVFLGAPVFTNCLVLGNVARHGGGIMNQKSGLVLTNCTVTENSAVTTGGGLRCIYESATTEISNSIFWGNYAGVDGDEVIDQADAVTTISYSDIRGGWVGAGWNNIDVDPLFEDGASGEVQLRPFSACIDAADNTAIANGEAGGGGAGNDLEGNPRFVDDPMTADSGMPDGVHPPVDMGACEFQLTQCGGDINGGSGVDFSDLLDLLQAWGPCPGCPEDLNGDGVVDLEDLLLLLDRWGPCIDGE